MDPLLDTGYRILTLPGKANRLWMTQSVSIFPQGI